MLIKVGITSATIGGLLYWQRDNPSLIKFRLKHQLLAPRQIQDGQHTFFDHKIKNPIGLASGYDIDGDMIEGLQALGFGFLELGSVTPLWQAPKKNDEQTYQYETNSSGALKMKANLIANMRNNKSSVPIGVSIIPNEETIIHTPNLMANDFINCYRELLPFTNYVVLNLVGSASIKEIYQDSIDKQFLVDLLKDFETIREQEIKLYSDFKQDIDEKTNSPRVAHLYNLPLVDIEAMKRSKLLIKLDSKSKVLKDIQQMSIDGIVLEKNTDQSEQEYLDVVKKLSVVKPVISVGEIKTQQQVQLRLQNGAVAVQVLRKFLESPLKFDQFIDFK